MKLRRVLYIAMLVASVLVLSRFTTAYKDDIIPDPQPLSKESVIADFKDASIAGDEKESFTPRAVIFPQKYGGGNGDEFYIEAQDSSASVVTFRYQIKAREKGDKQELFYILKDSWAGVTLPEQRFERHPY